LQCQRSNSVIIYVPDTNYDSKFSYFSSYFSSDFSSDFSDFSDTGLLL
jgi:hypothetical protein